MHCVYLATCLFFVVTLVRCSTTEQEVAELIDVLAANEINSLKWQGAVNDLAAIDRPAARQLIAILSPSHYQGENYREFREEIEQLRTGSARALGKIKPRAASALSSYVGSDYTENERLASIWALGELGYAKPAVTTLRGLLTDENSQIRLQSSLALLKMAEDDIDLEIVTALEGDDELLAEAAIDGLANTNHFGVPLLVQLISKQGDRSSQLHDILMEISDQLITQLSHEDPELRLNSARALGLIEGSGGQERLISLLDDPNNQVRFNAAAALARMGVTAGIRFLFDALFAEDSILRTNAVIALVEVQSASAVVEENLISTLRHENALARAAAAQILGEARVIGSINALIAATEDTVASVRWTAARSLGSLRAHLGRSRLRLLLDDHDDTVVYYAKWALNQLGRG